MIKRTSRISAAAAATAFGVLLAASPYAFAAGASADDAHLQAEVNKALDSSRLKNVTATVDGGNVRLAGTVQVYADKENADRKTHHVHGVRGVDNEIEVAEGSMSDVELRNKLANALATDRVGYGTTAFNAITIGVNHGVVTLGGTVYGPSDKDSAIGLVENTPGVRDVVDNLDVAPLSPMDDQLRVRLARTIYGAPQLQKYELDPAKPIRITVINGKVTLSGVVDNQGDKDVANIKANSVPGVFKVTNDLQVAGPQKGS
jgi:osmotically-inducible protein OsmY